VTFPLERLAELREAAGMTQTDLAVNLGVSYRTVQRWEGNEAKPSGLAVVRLFEVFPAAGTNGSKKRGR
jgi:DNA-binding transcriptional regulator YiaG